MSTDRSSTRLPLAVDGLFSPHPEGTRGGLPLGHQEEATVVDSSQASSTAALRGGAVRGGVALVQEEDEATVVDSSQASSTAALRGEPVALGRQEGATGRTKALLTPHADGTRGGLLLEEATGGIQGLPAPGLRSSAVVLRDGHGTRGGLAREELTGGIESLPGVALNPRPPQAMMSCGSSSSSNNKGGVLSLSSDEIKQFHEILQNLKMNEPASIRSICRTALKLYHDGQNRVALAISEYLVVKTKCPDNTVALNLCAGLHHSEGAEAMQLVHRGDKEASRAAAFHYSMARQHYQAAARLAPRCIVTAVAHGKVLAVSELFASAQQELQRGNSILPDSADDPAKHNVGYDIRRRASSENILHTTAIARIDRAHAEAVREVQKFESMICERYIPFKCTDSLMQLERGVSILEEVLDLAHSMSHDFKYCIRTHVFLTYLQLLCLELEDSEEEVMTRKLGEALNTLNKSTRAAKNSLFIAFLRAKILLMAGNLVDASTEVCRALDVRAPSDPKTEDVPVGLVEGVDADSRNSFVRRMLEDVLTRIRASEEPNQQDNEAPPSSSSAKSRRSSAFLYTHVPRKHQEPPLKFTGIEVAEKKAPLTFPVHFVRGRLVSLWDWSLYRKFCKASSRCEDGQIACHLCCFELGRDAIIIRERDEIAHHHRVHVGVGKEQSECIRCEVAGCHARMRTFMDRHLHRYFVHRLGPGWWRIT